MRHPLPLLLLFHGCGGEPPCDVQCPVGTNRVDVDFESVVSDGILTVESTECASFCEPIVQCRFPNVPVATEESYSCTLLDGYSTLPSVDAIDTHFATFWRDIRPPTITTTVSSNWSALTFGDLNGDGMGDILGVEEGAFHAYLSAGDGTFDAPLISPLQETTGYAVAIGHFNEDDFADIVLTTSGFDLVLYAGDGTGSFTNSNEVGPGMGGALFTAGDLDEDGLDDLYTGQLGGSVLYANPNGEAFTNVPLPTAPWALTGIELVPLDANGDGRIDLATGESGGSLFVNEGNRVFSAARTRASGTSSVQTLAVADINADGREDLLLWDSEAHLFSAYDEDLVFLSSFDSPAGRFSPLRADMDGDGAPDSTTPGGGTLLTHSGSPYFSTRLEIFGQRSAAMDVDGDGFAEAVVLNSTTGETIVVWQ